MKSKKSPSIDICKFTGKNGWCLGCGRTKVEARKWKNLKPYDIKLLEKQLKIIEKEQKSLTNFQLSKFYRPESTDFKGFSKSGTIEWE